jgi:hypothetical protein
MDYLQEFLQAIPAGMAGMRACARPPSPALARLISITLHSFPSLSSGIGTVDEVTVHS